jgi:glycosyltransferase involved in cell wall biosynthesis
MSKAASPRLTHLGVNALFLEPQMGGIETYVRALYPAILAVRPDLRMSFFVNERGHEALSSEDWVGHVELVSHSWLGRRGTRAVTEAGLLGVLADRRRCDVLHSVALTAPFRARAANVITVADVTWLRQRGAVPLSTRVLWRTLVIPAARRAERLVTLSEVAKAEISEDLDIPAERIDAIPLGPGTVADTTPTPEAALRERLGLGASRIVLAVSALLAHKNVGALVEALPEIRRAVPAAMLVVPGNETPLGARLTARAEALGVADAFVRPGWVSPADLEGLYAAAACFAFPSFREGFGLPILEAMRRGLPVACSNTSAVPEVAGDAALTFDPHRPAEIAAAVIRLLQDEELARSLSQRGRERAALFSWKRTAEETLASFERALDGR